MAKTVFGIPGVGGKTEGGGAAVASGGAPGAKSGGELPQKSDGEKSATKEQKPVKPGLNLSSSLSAKPKGPVMAKPMPVPVAKPVAGSQGPADKTPNAGKTMFGMPAMKIPGVPDLAELQKEQKAEPAPESATTEPPAEVAPAGDAYNATVLGMAPVAEDGAAAQEEVAEERPTSASESPAEDIASAAPSMSEPEPASAMSEEPREDSYAPAKKSPPWIMIGIGVLIVVVLAVVAFVMFGSSDSSSSATDPATSNPPADVAPAKDAPKPPAP